MESLGASPTGIFVTGTDTGVGKTSVACALVRLLRAAGLRVGALKPVATGLQIIDGNRVSTDGVRLREALGGDVHQEHIVPLAYFAPLAPPAAARREGELLKFDHLRTRFDEARHWWSTRADALVVEGVGGFLCPIAEDATVADLAALAGYPVLLVARAGLGTLNHTLLTVDAVVARGLELAAILLNQADAEAGGDSAASNPAELARRLAGLCPIASICYNPGGILAGQELSALRPTAWLGPPRPVAAVP